MIPLEDYRLHLQNLAQQALRSRNRDWAKTVGPILDGQVTRLLTLAVDREELRASGAFFSGSRLSSIAASHLPAAIPGKPICVLDPACGSGDLLIAAAKRLPTFPSLLKTANFWTDSLVGYDIHENFVEIARARLMLLLLSRRDYSKQSLPAKYQFAKKIVCADFLASAAPRPHLATHYLLNPPYTFTSASESWGKGRVSCAALFTSKCVALAQPGAKVIAILPDALRSGSRHKRWRESIISMGSKSEFKALGPFITADIDVSLLVVDKATVAPKQSARETRKRRRIPRVSDRFTINVGTVVPFRDKKAGPEKAFIEVGCAKPWETLRIISNRRRYRGKNFIPPLVVIRRTSSPNDKVRGIGTLIAGKRTVSIENHLIVALPDSGRITDCRRLMRSLKNTQTTRWLNRRIRCRHLTVESIRDLPLWSWK